MVARRGRGINDRRATNGSARGQVTHATRDVACEGLLLTATLAIACGDDADPQGSGSDDGGSAFACAPALDSCGGDAIGRWRVVEGCEPVSEDCLDPFSTVVEEVEIDPASEIGIEADGTLGGYMEVGFDIVLGAPLSCVEPAYQDLGCAGGEPCRISSSPPSRGRAMIRTIPTTRA